MRGWGASTKSLFFCQFSPQVVRSPHRLPVPRQIETSNRPSSIPTMPPGLPCCARRRTARPQRAWPVCGGGGISCVPFARNASGIAVGGNAWQWWDNAAGVYARGSVPESGSVLAFRSNGRMRLGHVAVVSRVINPREIEIEHANWWGAGMYGGVARNIPVVDVSAANDWTAVRVGIGENGQFGSVYPTYGFIYDRADTGEMLAASALRHRSRS